MEYTLKSNDKPFIYVVFDLDGWIMKKGKRENKRHLKHILDHMLVFHPATTTLPLPYSP